MTDLPSERTRLLRLTVAPAALVAVLGGAALAIQYLTASAPSAGRTTDGSSPAVGLTVIGAFAVLTVLVLALAARRARRAEREARRREETREALVRDWVAHYSAAVAAARGELREMLQQVLHGGRPEQPAAPAPVTPGDAYAALDQELRLLHHEAAMAVLHASAHQQVEVFVNIARRLQSLVTRSLQELDALEGEVEDPELLGGLLRVDHLGTRLRRHVESLAVLGGATPRRIGRPVAVYTVLRQALSEIEQYARVKILRPVEGTLKGHVVTDVIHLVAELIENATNFSRPETQVHVRAQLVAAGLAIEIDDRGLGIPLEERDRLERLLTRPDLVDLGEQLKDGRIGLFVVARLAQRHGIAVRAQSNIYGGTQAVVVIPLALLETEPAAPPAAAPRQAPVRTDELPRRQAAPAAAAVGAGRSAAGTWRGEESGTADWTGATAAPLPGTTGDSGADAPVIDWTGSTAWRESTSQDARTAHGGGDSAWANAGQAAGVWSAQRGVGSAGAVGAVPDPGAADAASGGRSWPPAQQRGVGSAGAVGAVPDPGAADAASGGRSWPPAQQQWTGQAALEGGAQAGGWPATQGPDASWSGSPVVGAPGAGTQAAGAEPHHVAGTAWAGSTDDGSGAATAAVPGPDGRNGAGVGGSWSGSPTGGHRPAQATAGGAEGHPAPGAGNGWSGASVSGGSAAYGVANAAGAGGSWSARTGDGRPAAGSERQNAAGHADPAGAGRPGESAGGPEQAREALPVRPRPGVAAAPEEASVPQAWNAPVAGGGWTPGGAVEHGGSGTAPAPGAGERPPLPRRTGSYLVPELRDRISQPGSARPGPTPDLMARFSLGQQRAEDPDQ